MLKIANEIMFKLRLIIYDKVMQKLYENLNDIQYFEIDSFSDTQTNWKFRDEGA